jgi:hypothetical protein
MVNSISLPSNWSYNILEIKQKESEVIEIEETGTLTIKNEGYVDRVFTVYRRSVDGQLKTFKAWEHKVLSALSLNYKVYLSAPFDYFQKMFLKQIKKDFSSNQSFSKDNLPTELKMLLDIQKGCLKTNEKIPSFTIQVITEKEITVRLDISLRLITEDIRQEEHLLANRISDRDFQKYPILKWGIKKRENCQVKTNKNQLTFDHLSIASLKDFETNLNELIEENKKIPLYPLFFLSISFSLQKPTKVLENGEIKNILIKDAVTICSKPFLIPELFEKFKKMESKL